MKSIAAAWLFLLAIACATFSLTDAHDSVRQLRSADGVCTAWAIAPGRWLTAKHCLEIAQGWTIGGHEAAPLALDPQFDIALLTGPRGSAFLQVAETAPPLGVTVQTLGYGLGKDSLLSFPATVIDQESMFFGRPLGEFLVAGANGMPGMSGGPILYRGKVVSLITGGGPAASPAHLLGTGVTWASLRAFTRLHVGK